MNIDKLMKEMDVSIVDMCILTGTDRDTLYKWRAGIQKPTKAAVMLMTLIKFLYDDMGRDFIDYLINEFGKKKG